MPTYQSYRLTVGSQWPGTSLTLSPSLRRLVAAVMPRRPCSSAARGFVALAAARVHMLVKAGQVGGLGYERNRQSLCGEDEFVETGRARRGRRGDRHRQSRQAKGQAGAVRGTAQETRWRPEPARDDLHGR